jgi:hypothetical protein
MAGHYGLRSHIGRLQWGCGGGQNEFAGDIGAAGGTRSEKSLRIGRYRTCRFVENATRSCIMGHRKAWKAGRAGRDAIRICIFAVAVSNHKSAKVSEGKQGTKG